MGAPRHKRGPARGRPCRRAAPPAGPVEAKSAAPRERRLARQSPANCPLPMAHLRCKARRALRRPPLALCGAESARTRSGHESGATRRSTATHPTGEQVRRLEWAGWPQPSPLGAIPGIPNSEGGAFGRTSVPYTESAQALKSTWCVAVCITLSRCHCARQCVWALALVYIVDIVDKGVVAL